MKNILKHEKEVGNMDIELYIDGEFVKFSVPFVPMMARRKYNEIMVEIEKKGDLTPEEIVEMDDKLYSILTDIVFQGQFTLEQLYNGQSQEYINQKLLEAIGGKGV